MYKCAIHERTFMDERFQLVAFSFQQKHENEVRRE